MARKIIYYSTGIVLLTALICFYLMTRACHTPNLSVHSSDPIPSCYLLPSEGLRTYFSLPHTLVDFNFKRFSDTSDKQNVTHLALPKHPFMAQASNNMHNDAYVSDVYAERGPLGINSEIRSRTQGFGGYGTIAFDSQGAIIGVYSNGRGFELERMDPLTLEESHSYPLPGRSWYFPLQGVLPWKYIGAGMYFYLDEQDRAILPSNRNSIMVIQAPQSEQEDFTLIREYDLSEHVIELPWPKLDSVAWVLPEWNGQRYWFATIEGMIGTVNKTGGTVQTTFMKAPSNQQREIIENSFAIGEEGTFIITDHAMYRFSFQNGTIQTDWRTEYDPGPSAKPGHITRGSGSSVTLSGTPSNGLVIVTDNAEPQVHLEFYRRNNGERVCSVPLFEKGKSGTDLSVIAFQQTDNLFSVLVENNWGHHSFPVPDAHPGITRVDALRNNDGSFTCKTVWQSQEAGIAAGKLSLATGLFYMATYDDSPARNWYFSAIDFHSGKTVFKQRTGTGHGYNPWQGVLFLHPDNGVLYSTTIFGMVMMRDTGI